MHLPARTLAIALFGVVIGTMLLAFDGRVGGGDDVKLAQPAAMAVRISQPVLRQVGDYLDFAGRTQAVNSVEIRARVSGFLIKTAFKEGAESARAICCSRSIRARIRSTWKKRRRH